MAKTTNITFDTTGEYLRITFPKTISNRNYLQVRNRIESELEDKSDKVIIDLSNITSMESLFIGLLLHTRMIIKTKGGVVYLVNASKKCNTKLRSLFLDKIFTIYDDEKQVFSSGN